MNELIQRNTFDPSINQSLLILTIEHYACITGYIIIIFVFII